MKILPVLAFLLLPLLSAQSQTVALNDEFATREILTGSLPLTWSGYAGGLTIEPGFEDNGETRGTMWFEWTAPEAGIYSLEGAFPFSITLLAAPPLPEPQVPAASQLLLGRGMSYSGVLLRATAGQRLWILLANEEGVPIPDNRTSLRISRATPVPSAKENAVLLPSTATVSVSQVVDQEGWWRWHAPSAGLWRFLHSVGSFELLRADGSLTDADNFLPFPMSEGEELFIHAIPGPGTAIWTGFTLDPSPPPPVNLTPATALPLVPDENGGGLPAASGVWFSWTASRDGVISVLPFIGSADSVAVFRDDAGTLTRIDEGTFGLRNPYAIVTTGQRILIRAPGGFDLRVDYLPVRGSDSFAGAAPLGLYNAAADLLGDATVEPGEPGLLTATERTKWWTYTAPSDGFLKAWGRRLNVYTGSSPGSLTPVAALDYKDSGFGVTPWFNVHAGTVYRIQAFDSPIPNDMVRLFLEVQLKSPGDNFADAIPVSPSNLDAYRGNVSLIQATVEAGEPAVTPGIPATRTAWMRWTPGFTGRVAIVTSTAWAQEATLPLGQPVMAVWTGNSLASLQRVPVLPSGIEGLLPVIPALDVVADTTYFFQVEAPPDVTGFGVLMMPVFTDAVSCDSFATPVSADQVMAIVRLTITIGTFYKIPGRVTFEPGESTDGLPATPPGTSSGSYWIKWTAPTTGVWRFAVHSRQFNPSWALTLYGESLAGGSLAVMDASHPGPFYLKVNAGESINVGNIVYQSLTDNGMGFLPALPEISPAVPGIALATWYGLPSPANLNACYSSDGIPLLLKHALGLDPLRNSLPGGSDPNASRWPLLTLTPAGEPSLTFRSASPFQLGNGVDLSGEISRDLLTWLPAPESSIAGERTVRVPADGPSGFLRLKASLR